jgi:hypothetical protein
MGRKRKRTRFGQLLGRGEASQIGEQGFFGSAFLHKDLKGEIQTPQSLRKESGGAQYSIIRTYPAVNYFLDFRLSGRTEQEHCYLLPLFSV